MFPLFRMQKMLILMNLIMVLDRQVGKFKGAEMLPFLI